MNGFTKHRRYVVGLIAVLLGLLVATRASARPGFTVNPRIFSPDSRPFGKSYGEWSAAWWQWSFSIPAPMNPLLDDTGANCGQGQSGPVWFLAGKLCVTPNCTVLSATRRCDVPAGKALFFPIANSEADNLGVDPALDEAQLRLAAKGSMDGVTTMACTVDGALVRGLRSSATTRYRVVSPVFAYTIPDNNIYQALGAPFGSQTIPGAVADGVFLMLAPLPAGRHDIRFTATFMNGLALDITYRLSVAGARE
jgi:hypothetical protein